MIAVTSVTDYYSKIGNAPRSIVMYTSDSCKACKIIKDWLLTQSYSIPIFTIDVKQDNLYSLVQVYNLPTMDLYEYSQVKDTIEGFQQERILRWIKN